MITRNRILAAAALVACALLAWFLLGGDEPARGRASAEAEGGGGESGGETGGGGGLLSRLRDTFGEKSSASPGASWTGRLVRVEGNVIEAISSEPAGGIDIGFRTAEGEATATSASDGKYYIELAPGSYRVSVFAEQFLPLAQTTLVLAPTEQVVHFDVLLAGSATARGRVVDQVGRPVSGAIVTFTSKTPGRTFLSADLEPAGSAETGPDGGFELTIAAGDVTLQADDRVLTGYASLGIVPAFSERSGVEIAIPAGAGLYGTVTEPSGAPVAGATVNVAVRSDATGLWQDQSTTSGEGGAFAFDAIESGPTAIEAKAEGFGQSNIVRLNSRPGNDTRDIALVLGAGASISGTVVDAEGSAVSGIKVRVYLRGSQIEQPFVETDGDGRFEIEGLGAGPYDVLARAKGHGTARVLGVIPPATGVKLSMVSALGIRGTVKDGASKPVRDFEVHVVEWTSALDGRKRPGRAGGTRFASEDGRFELALIDPGKYKIAVVGPDHAPGIADNIEVPAGEWGTTKVEVDTGGVVSGTVKTAAGEPLAGARIVVVGGFDGAPSVTNVQGRYSLRVPSGRASLRITHPGYVEVLKEGISVSSGGKKSLDVQLSPTS